MIVKESVIGMAATSALSIRRERTESVRMWSNGDQATANNFPKRDSIRISDQAKQALLEQQRLAMTLQPN
jgi:hypothetical protein